MTTEQAPEVAIPSRYDPHAVEARWYEVWEQAGYFQPDPGSSAPTFVITIPPPNVTGDLHMGHALTYGIEDILGRFKRMQGYNTLILPGTDHAGIATQNVVEKQLATEGISRHDLGRERFVERVWTWKEQYAANIRRQFRAMGCAFDWSRERFTMDAGYVDAVLEFFIRLYEEDKIYRGWRVINWCTRCHSAISDIEVENETREDQLYYLRYPLASEQGDIVVATVRPETILGDTAIAVNPEDDRYRDLIGRRAILPLLGRELEIIADSFVDSSFGSGAVKITPAHDFDDFEVGERHGLAMPIAIDPQARITAEGGPYEGLTVAEARMAVLRDLEAGGYLVKVEPHQHVVPTCERCGTLLEPLLSEQWFMRMEKLAAPAIDVVRQEDVSFVPERWARIYLDWMENIRPWTLSRQLWWGHRIPVYYCANGHPTVSKHWPEACGTCGEPIDHQDPDVLDTWFSSALWPFATLGWPHETSDLATFYPTSFMNTSSQILYLWIARMVMTGLKFQQEIPFPSVLINPTILNKRGQRMSKSLGTGVDPLDLVREYGADALRYGLMTSGSTHQQDIRFAPERVEQARNFANKIWNVARFILTAQEEEPEQPLQLQAVDYWILSRLATTTEAVTADLERYEFSGAGHRLYDFIWGELADWYVEMAKTRLFDESDPASRYTARAVLWSVLDRTTRLLHPYMPFLADEIWQHVRSTGSPAARELSGWSEELPASVMIAPWPASGERQPRAEEEISLVLGLIRGIRTLRSEYGVDPGRVISATFVTPDVESALSASLDVLARLGRVNPSIVASGNKPPEGCVSMLVKDVTVYLPLAELTDIDAERDRLARELAGAEKQHAAVMTKLDNAKFLERAPADVVARERQRAVDLGERCRRLREEAAAFEK
ncbi:MAG: valine--tRNA ligase [Chloroflexota bacterium]